MLDWGLWALVLVLMLMSMMGRDRPWQAFPITILTGAYFGFAVGSVVCRSSWLFGKWLEFTPEQDDRDKKTE